jgi:transposase
VHVVRQHPATVRSVHNLRARNPGARFSGKRLQEWPTQDLPSWLTEEPQVLAVPSSRVVWDCLQQPIKTRDKTLPQRLKHPPAYEPLLTVQGLGMRLAHTLTLATGAISRLPTGGPSASSCRCVDRTQISHGKRKGTGPGTHGHPYVAWASLEAAQFARRCQPAAQRFAQRTLAKSRNHTGWARQAVAHQRARAGYDRMRDLVPCEATQALG